MPVTIVVGGQYGSEGKGKVAALLARRSNKPWLVRCGGPNSGHTVTIDGQAVILRQIPSSTRPGVGTFCVAAGSVVDEALLLNEVDSLRISSERIVVDPRAVLVDDSDRLSERQHLSSIGSTCSGTGEALIRRLSRTPTVRLAKDSQTLRVRCRVESVAPLLHDALSRDEHVIVEGSQGFGLSVLHSQHYPFVTSRDTTAAGFASEVGLSPRLVDEIVVVVRTFPIRVAGTSGPLLNEISWEVVRDLSGAPQAIPEFTSVTKRLRRVATFDLEAVARACQYNAPTSLAVMGLDRLDYANTGVRDLSQLSHRARAFLREIEKATGVPVEFYGTGFGTDDVIVVPIGIREGRRAHAQR
jgi:adenylosuccinate synthase